ncbi:hypothetical protein BUTYVIB_02286 [Eshraghiella crossota DSM 2876]|uniref:Uncharacterized protein n=1 Tax=Eshraghiella crossota DSM 2876 TaxID=511680 RepID=D4S2G4_9FIRM|nr:hypothetical protein BUTYVIB_02286 [Butyrivibrio crossotus DSM 2876]
MEHQQENKHEQSEYLFSPDVTTTKPLDFGVINEWAIPIGIAHF